MDIYRIYVVIWYIMWYMWFVLWCKNTCQKKVNRSDFSVISYKKKQTPVSFKSKRQENHDAFKGHIHHSPKIDIVQNALDILH